jgi:hypothetical protein
MLFGISGINLCHLGAFIEHFEVQKPLQGGGQLPLYKQIFFGLIWGHPVFLTPYNGVKNMYSKGLYNEYLKTILKFAKWN